MESAKNIPHAFIIHHLPIRTNKGIREFGMPLFYSACACLTATRISSINSCHSA